jgi:hypothetical protein
MKYKILGFLSLLPILIIGIWGARSGVPSDDPYITKQGAFIVYGILGIAFLYYAISELIRKKRKR